MSECAHLLRRCEVLNLDVSLQSQSILVFAPEPLELQIVLPEQVYLIC